MFPPSDAYNLDIDAISGICGSVSIACWVVVYSPQIMENFRRSSADGLSIEFIIIWTAGDVFNMLGAVLQRVLPTMIILAVYYTFADIVLLGQCFYYRGFHFRDPRPELSRDGDAEPTEVSPLAPSQHTNGETIVPRGSQSDERESDGHRKDIQRTRSASSFRQRIASLDATYLSPAMPMYPSEDPEDSTTPFKPHQPTSLKKKILFNLTAIVLVVAAGVAGYYLSPASKISDRDAIMDQDDTLTFSLWGQIFGYFCAVLYLGSRIPQLLLNYRRKSTEGLNALFFLFACIGNVTYVLSIFAFKPLCHGQNGDCSPGEVPSIYGRYILVNTSWIIGSFGTFLLDLGVSAQFWIYRKDDHGYEHVRDDAPRAEDGARHGRVTNER